MISCATTNTRSISGKLKKVSGFRIRYLPSVAAIGTAFVKSAMSPFWSVIIV